MKSFYPRCNGSCHEHHTISSANNIRYQRTNTYLPLRGYLPRVIIASYATMVSGNDIDSLPCDKKEGSSGVVYSKIGSHWHYMIILFIFTLLLLLLGIIARRFNTNIMHRKDYDNDEDVRSNSISKGNDQSTVNDEEDCISCDTCRDQYEGGANERAHLLPSRYVSFQYCMPTNEKATKNIAIPHPSLAYPREKCMERNNELLTRKYDGRTWNMYNVIISAVDKKV